MHFCVCCYIGLLVLLLHLKGSIESYRMIFWSSGILQLTQQNIWLWNNHIISCSLLLHTGYVSMESLKYLDNSKYFKVFDLVHATNFLLENPVLLLNSRSGFNRYSTMKLVEMLISFWQIYPVLLTDFCIQRDHCNERFWPLQIILEPHRVHRYPSCKAYP